MPKMNLYSPHGTFDLTARQNIAAQLTELGLDCETLPKSPFVKSTVWLYFIESAPDEAFMGSELAYRKATTLEVRVIKRGLNAGAKQRFITEATRIIAEQLNEPGSLAPVYVVIEEVEEEHWGIFGQQANLTALRESAPDQPAI